ncbi:MAG: hypothetical protein HZA36_00155 [Parcubacteria group bacterium]|nr:hypothetical protein [Parcubacteria group bacterium]
MEEVSSFSVIDDEALFDRLEHLYATWPSDGWVGAAAEIACHAKRAREIEEEFARRHAISRIHHPVHPYYRRQCCCRKGSELE